MKRRTNNDKDRSVTQESAHHGGLRPGGAVSLPVQAHASAGAQNFTKGRWFGKPGPADANRLAASIGVQRDAQGGYGSPLATRSVVRALVTEGPSLKETSHVQFESEGTKQDVEVSPSAHLVLPLPAGATKVAVRVKGPGVVARFERPVLRLWSHPPVETTSPLSNT